LPGGLGILGGTFNPPHRGHLAVAACARAQLGLERVLLMPSCAPPHKPAREDPGPEHRLRMCRLAVEGHEGIEASALEIERGGPSYTVDTLLELHARAEADDPQPAPRPTLILGSDMAGTLPAWRSPQEIVELADIAVAERPGDGRESVLSVLEPLDARARFLEMPPIDISSSLVRLRVARGEPVGEMVGDAVAAYIAEHRLYRMGGVGGGAGRAGEGDLG
jgi:nicotinate-nucleotide adenylyltransferase